MNKMLLSKKGNPHSHAVKIAIMTADRICLVYKDQGMNHLAMRWSRVSSKKEYLLIRKLMNSKFEIYLLTIKVHSNRQMIVKYNVKVEI